MREPRDVEGVTRTGKPFVDLLVSKRDICTMHIPTGKIYGDHGDVLDKLIIIIKLVRAAERKVRGETRAHNLCSTTTTFPSKFRRDQE